MKKHGKINTHCREETEEFKNLDVPRANTLHSREFSKDEIDKRINNLVDEIRNNYSYENCLLIVGSPKNIPHSLCMLLYSGEDTDSLTVWNLDYNYRKYQHGQYDAYEFLCMLESLFKTLLNEFDEIMEMFLTGSIERKETDYERT